MLPTAEFQGSRDVRNMTLKSKPFHLCWRTVYLGDELLAETGCTGLAFMRSRSDRAIAGKSTQSGQAWLRVGVADLIAGPFSAADDNSR